MRGSTLSSLGSGWIGLAATSSFRISCLRFSERSLFVSTISSRREELEWLLVFKLSPDFFPPQIRSQPSLYSGVDTLEKWLIDNWDADFLADPTLEVLSVVSFNIIGDGLREYYNRKWDRI